MGKRNTRSRGIARFALDLLKESSASTEVEATTEVQDDALEASTSQMPAPKKRKLTHEESSWVEKYDATGLVPHYTRQKDVPDHLKKYFSQRKRLFSLPGVLLDEEGWYSVTPERIADQIAERCRCDTILDPFCGVGGNAIAFAKTCQRVIALDTNPTRLALARHNAQVYGVAPNIEFILSDYISFANAHLSCPPTKERRIDVVFLSPPWGGPSYLTGSPPKKPSLPNDTPGDDYVPYSLQSILPIPGAELFHLTRKITRNVAYFLPRNTSLEEVSALLDEVNATEVLEKVEAEEEWMGTKLKALTCYFGGLAAGQDTMF